MARKRRIEFPGALYHVIARGNNRQATFKDDQDYKVYIDRLKRYQQRYSFILYAYTLMPNHVHMIMETAITPLSKIMQGIHQSYTFYFHNKYKTVGHLFQGRYKAILIEKEVYLQELVRYIHLNPFRAFLVENPDDYPWSSHQVYIGKINQAFVRDDIVFQMLSSDITKAQKLYRQFIIDGMRKRHLRKFHEEIDTRFLGSTEFIEECKRKAKENIDLEAEKDEKKLKLLYEQMPINKISLDTLVTAVSEATGISTECILGKSKAARVSYVRSLFVYMATRYAGTSNKSLALFLGKEDSSVSNMIRRFEEKIVKNPSFFEEFDKIRKVMKV
jgi:REP element-mobilizing transposase RayT